MRREEVRRKERGGEEARIELPPPGEALLAREAQQRDTQDV